MNTNNFASFFFVAFAFRSCSCLFFSRKCKRLTNKWVQTTPIETIIWLRSSFCNYYMDWNTHLLCCNFIWNFNVLCVVWSRMSLSISSLFYGNGHDEKAVEWKICCTLRISQYNKYFNLVCWTSTNY